LNLELETNTIGHGSITPLEYANKEMVSALDHLLKKKNRIIFNDLNISFIKGIGEHKKGLVKTVLKHPKYFRALFTPRLRKQPEIFALFSNTITLTNIYTNNDSFNKIPSKIGAYLDCRLMPSTNENEFIAEVKKRLKNDNIKINIVELAIKSEASSIESIYYQGLEKAIIKKYENAEVMPILLPNINDLGVFRTKGIPCYASVPIMLSRKQAESVHNENENISIPLLYDGSDVYYNFLKNITFTE
jgi:acetylornithine deacetylase/succinyl-diaminopimelate desuccinylase-like protein